ncbi:MAG: metallophosphoesterase family protein [Clostridia bacterium]|nr:metallophosphoesterase family protein [Clostridia bacterium]
MKITVNKVIALVLTAITLCSIAAPVVGAVDVDDANTKSYPMYDQINDGELIYQANFNGDGRYDFKLKESTGAVDTLSGTSATLTVGSTGKVTTAGGPISGLPLDEGQCYTVDFSIAMEDGSSTHYMFLDPDNRYGFAIRRDKMVIEGKGYAFSFEYNGWITYGDPIASEALTVESRNFNKYNFRAIVDSANKAVRFYYLNKNGVWVLTDIGTNFTPDTDTLNLYFGAYTANKKAIFSDVRIYKGNQFSEYDNAENLDLLYKVNFKENKYVYGNINNNVATSNPSDDGSALTLKSNVTTNEFHCIGGEINGLPIDSKSLYTVEFSTSLPSTGFVGLAPAADTTSLIGGYGFALKSGSAKRETSDFSNGKMSTWDTITNIANTNGKYSFRLVIDGSNKTVALYYLNTSNVWIKLNVTGEGFKQVTNNLYLCLGNYSKNDTEISDISIYKGDLCTEISKADLDIPEGKKAIYEADINYQGEPVRVSHGMNELVSISSDAICLCGFQVSGNYGNGTYHLKLSIAPEQKMTIAEITLPNGAIIRRGHYLSVSRSTRITVSSLDAACVSNSTVNYEDISLNDYAFDVTEPQYEGFAAKVYNLVTSFSDARYDRAFAWTALDSFIGNGEMAVRYREQGGEWKTVTATKEALSTSNDVEAYFKADIVQLKADTTYEYQIGKKDSTNYDNDWSKVYTFKTAAEKVNNFSFIMTGDNQSESWGNRTNATKGGYMYTQTAIDQAIETVNPAFIMNVGDMAESAAPNAINQWNWFFKAMGEHTASIPHFATLGNHECLAPEYFDAHFNHPNNGGSAAFNQSMLASGGVTAAVKNNLDETTYSFDYGDVHFIVLNSGANYQVVKGQYEATLNAQKNWLVKDLQANADARWTILITHQNIYDLDSGESNLSWLSNLIEEYGVDLVFQGHWHNLSRSYPMKNGQIATKISPDLITKGSGTTYVTIGSNTYNKTTDMPSAEMFMNMLTPYSEQPTYTSVEVEDNKIVVTIKQVDGLVLDKFTLVDNSEPDTDEENKNNGTTNGNEDNNGTGDSTDTGDTSDTETDNTTETPPPTETPKSNKKGVVIAIVATVGTLTIAVGVTAAIVETRKKKNK